MHSVGRGLHSSTHLRILAALLFVLCCFQSGKSQRCTEGFTYDSRSRQCIDVDECRTGQNPCRGDMRCVNQNGGYLCLPRSLYSQPYARAEPLVYPEASYPEASYPDTSVGTPDQFPLSPPLDIDECEAESHQCNPTQVCINTAGGYTCSCTEGYWLVGGQCQDIDECRYGYCQQLCANLPGSYSCSCNPGFNLNTDSRTCQDIDECETQPCTHGCLNTYGSFLCNCDEGFELAADGTTCNDLDECSFSDFLCQHTCLNTPGSYSCVCPPGYYVFEDGRTCEDLNECESGNNTCTTAQVCFNFQGGYTCLDPLTCLPPYVELSENVASRGSCTHRNVWETVRIPSLLPGFVWLFFCTQTSNVSATLVLARPIRGPKTVVLDLEMVTVNNVINFRGSSIIRLTIFVSEHPF
uniref:Fibulin 5 n=1 Tax=Astyanax mexicanus TaxID=7994 RepID=A0A8B9H8L7_ASTMX